VPAGNGIRLKLTSLQAALKQLTDKKPKARFAVVVLYNQLFLEMNKNFTTNAIKFVLFVRLFCAFLIAHLFH